MKGRLVLTGGTGFIGSHLVEKLQDWEVTCLTSPTAIGQRKIPNVNIEFCDLTQYDKIRDIVKRANPNVVIHLAALTPVRYSFERPEVYQDVNYYSTVNLIHVTKDLPDFQRFIFASTMEVYGWQPVKKPFVENTPLNPASPYAVSKVAAESYVKMAGKAFKFPHMIARCCNTYGRKTETGYIIEFLITEMLKNRAPRVGTPDAVRDLQYVDDHVNAYLSLLNFELESEKERLDNLEKDPNYYVFNFGNGLELRIAQIAEKIKSMIGFSGDIIRGFPSDYPQRPVVESYLSLNATKAFNILKWKPKVSLEEGLKRTVDYWKNK